MAETLPMDLDYAEQTADLMRKKTLVLGEVDSDSQPATPPEHVQPGKLLQPKDHVEPLTTPAAAEPSAGTPHQVEGSKPEPAAALEQVALDDQDGSESLGPKKNESSKAAVSMVNKLPSSASSSAEAPAAAPESDPVSPGEAADIDTVPMVTREDQHAYKGAKQPKKPRGRKPAVEEKKPKRSKALKPAVSRKRPASKPPVQEAKKEEVSDENDPDMPDVKRDLEEDFADAASEAAAHEVTEPEKPIRKARAKSKNKECGGGEKSEKNVNKDDEKPITKGKNMPLSDGNDKGCQALPLCLKRKSGEKERMTFAGRGAPKSVEANNRFMVLLKTYTDKIAPFLKSSSQVEVGVTNNTEK